MSSWLVNIAGVKPKYRDITILENSLFISRNLNLYKEVSMRSMSMEAFEFFKKHSEKYVAGLFEYNFKKLSVSLNWLICCELVQTGVLEENPRNAKETETREHRGSGRVQKGPFQQAAQKCLWQNRFRGQENDEANWEALQRP